MSAAGDSKLLSGGSQIRAKRIYEQYFLRKLCRRLRLKHDLYPDLYDTSDRHLVCTIRDLDERYTAHDGGFKDADDYYSYPRANDPLVPFEPLKHSSVESNPYVLLLTPKPGGHVGFVADHVKEQDRSC